MGTDVMLDEEPELKLEIDGITENPEEPKKE